MVEMIIVAVLLILSWKSIGYAFKYWGERVQIWSKDHIADLQNDYKTVYDKITDIKKQNNGKWYTNQDLDDLMK